MPAGGLPRLFARQHQEYQGSLLLAAQGIAGRTAEASCASSRAAPPLRKAVTQAAAGTARTFYLKSHTPRQPNMQDRFAGGPLRGGLLMLNYEVKLEIRAQSAKTYGRCYATS